MGNPHPKGNPNVANITNKPSAQTPIGKLRRNIKLFNRDYVKQYSPEALELYDWLCSNDVKQIDYLLELKNLYSVMQQVQFPSILDKIQKNEPLGKRDIEALRLMKDVLAESHKLKYGDKKVIESVVTIEDIRNQMRSENIVGRRIVDAEVLKDEEDNLEKNENQNE